MTTSRSRGPRARASGRRWSAVVGAGGLLMLAVACGGGEGTPASPSAGPSVEGLWITTARYTVQQESSGPIITSSGEMTLRLRQDGSFVTGIVSAFNDSVFDVTGTVRNDGTLVLGGTAFYPQQLGFTHVLTSFVATLVPGPRLKGSIAARFTGRQSNIALYSSDFDAATRLDLEPFAADPTGIWSGYSFAKACRPLPPFFCILTGGFPQGVSLRLSGSTSALTGELSFQHEFSKTVVEISGHMGGRQLVLTSRSSWVAFRDDCRLEMDEWARAAGQCTLLFRPPVSIPSENDVDLYQIVKRGT